MVPITADDDNLSDSIAVVIINFSNYKYNSNTIFFFSIYPSAEVILLKNTIKKKAAYGAWVENQLYTSSKKKSSSRVRMKLLLLQFRPCVLSFEF